MLESSKANGNGFRGDGDGDGNGNGNDTACSAGDGSMALARGPTDFGPACQYVWCMVPLWSGLVWSLDVSASRPVAVALVRMFIRGQGEAVAAAGCQTRRAFT
jgi:hypothetical protein